MRQLTLRVASGKWNKVSVRNVWNAIIVGRQRTKTSAKILLCVPYESLRRNLWEEDLEFESSRFPEATLFLFALQLQHGQQHQCSILHGINRWLVSKI